MSLFYKDFSDPIEEVLVEGVTRIQTWENASTASNQGFELELRRGSAPSPTSWMTSRWWSTTRTSTPR